MEDPSQAMQRKPPPQPGGGNMPKVKDALGYLEKVKNKFSTKPQVYNQFLDIMKDFKSQAIDTEGVIRRVKILFKGHRNLILGFNQFLPPGYKIELPPDKPPAPQPAAKPNIEFNHAVQYVAKIKNRFRDEPDIYAAFLDILHEYQQKRTISEVYARVQELFGNEPDLLDEFKYFLPDNSVQQPARRQPKAQRVPRPMPATTAPAAPPKSKLAGDMGPKGSHLMALPPSRTPRGPMVPPSTTSASSAAAAASAAAKRAAQKTLRAEEVQPEVSYPPGTERELAAFERLQRILPKSHWMQLLQVLDLYNAKIVHRREMMRAIKDIMGEKMEEDYNRFAEAIEFDDWEEEQHLMAEHSNYYAYVGSPEFQRSQHVTPSYRQLPNDIPIPPCTARSTLCEEVLNDRVISMPMGSEDQSFKSTRKNIYEENLFKCEDERYELDNVIENNTAAIQALEPLARKIQNMTPEEAKEMRLPKTVDILHVKSIARLYGDQGTEVIDLLKKNPANTVPVVLQRLKQKDEEWRRVRHDLKNTWRRIMEQNYAKSLDHRSFYFKQEDKRRLHPRNLILELRDKHDQVFKGAAARDEDTIESSSQPPLYNYCLRYKFDQPSVHTDIYRVVEHVGRKIMAPAEWDKVHTFWAGFVNHFFSIAPSSGDLDGPAGGVSGAADEAEHKMEVVEDANVSVEMDDTTVGDKRQLKTPPTRPAAKRPRLQVTPTLPLAQETPSTTIVSPSSRTAKRGEVKPLRVMMETWALEEKFSPVRRHTRASHLFCGGNAFYVFFRLHELLYARLAKAAELAQKYKPRDPVNEAVKTRGKKRKKKRPAPRTPEEAHAQFYTLLFELLDEQVDANKFEDECRSLLGASAFVLYTLDRLIQQLVKQAQAIVSNDLCIKLLSLYQYEFSRSREAKKTEEASAQLARMYHSNCLALTGEDHCIQVEYFEDSHEMGIGLVDGMAATETQERKVTQELNTYLDRYLNNRGSWDVVPRAARPVVLPRNVRSGASRLGANPLEGCIFHNGLEMMIDQRSFKMAYVEETGDMLVRVRGRARVGPRRTVEAKQAIRKAKAAKVHQFVDAKLVSLNPGFDPAAPVKLGIDAMPPEVVALPTDSTNNNGGAVGAGLGVGGGGGDMGALEQAAALAIGGMTDAGLGLGGGGAGGIKQESNAASAAAANSAVQSLLLSAAGAALNDEAGGAADMDIDAQADESAADDAGMGGNAADVSGDGNEYEASPANANDDEIMQPAGVAVPPPAAFRASANGARGAPAASAAAAGPRRTGRTTRGRGGRLSAREVSSDADESETPARHGDDGLYVEQDDDANASQSGGYGASGRRRGRGANAGAEPGSQRTRAEEDSDAPAEDEW